MNSSVLFDPRIKVFASNEFHGAGSVAIGSDGGQALRLNPTVHGLPTHATKGCHIRHCQQDLLADAVTWLRLLLSRVRICWGGSHTSSGS